MVRTPLVVIGASAGGVEALSHVVAGLPADLPACVLVVLHIPAHGPSALGHILDRRGPLPARTACDGDALEVGQILVAPPDRHLLVTDDKVVLSAGARENGHRPSIDVLFQSAAESHGANTVAVVLSGMLDDGAAGAAAVRAASGVVLVQDPADAHYPAMPTTVIHRIGPDGVAPAHELGPLIGKHCAPLASHLLTAREEETMQAVQPAVASGRALGPASGFMCPDCHGSLYVVDEQPILRFRCRVGHAWGSDDLLHQQDISIEGSVWVALRTLEEKAELCNRLADRAAAEGRGYSRERYSDSAREALVSAERIRQLLDLGVAGSRSVTGPAAPDVEEAAGP